MDESESPSPPTRRAGRPRDARVEQAILDATLTLLTEVGFEAMSIEAVAARAGVGKTAIYRRWPSKEDVVVDLITRLHTDDVPVIDTGNLRDDLLALALGADSTGSAREALQRLLPRFLGESSTNPALFATYQESVIRPRLRMISDLVERAIARGEVRPDIDPTIVIDLVVGALTWRGLITARIFPTRPDYAARMLDTIWQGIAARGHPD